VLTVMVISRAGLRIDRWFSVESGLAFSGIWIDDVFQDLDWLFQGFGSIVFFRIWSGFFRDLNRWCFSRSGLAFSGIWIDGVFQDLDWLFQGFGSMVFFRIWSGFFRDLDRWCFSGTGGLFQGSGLPQTLSLFDEVKIGRFQAVT
jgi:hypothetical protein